MWPPLLISAVFVFATPTAHGQREAAQGRLITSLAVAVNPSTHKVYAVDEEKGTVSVFDEQTRSSREVKVGDAPIALAINATTNRIYVVNTDSNSTSVIDGTHDEVIATIKGGSHPYSLAVNEATNKTYVTYTYSDSMTIIDGNTNTAQTLKTGSADGIAVDPDSNTLFLTTYEDPNIRIVKAASGAISKVRVGPHIWGITFDKTLKTLFLAHTGTADITSLNEENHEVKTIRAGAIPCAVAINPVSQMIYAVNYDDESVSAIDARKGKVVATLKVGRHPQAVAVDAVHNRVYVANVHGNSVTAIDGAKNTLIGTYDAGKNPYALAVDPSGTQVYAANYGEPAVTRIDVSSAPSPK